MLTFLLHCRPGLALHCRHIFASKIWSIVRTVYRLWTSCFVWFLNIECKCNWVFRLSDYITSYFLVFADLWTFFLVHEYDFGLAMNIHDLILDACFVLFYRCLCFILRMFHVRMFAFVLWVLVLSEAWKFTAGLPCLWIATFWLLPCLWEHAFQRCSHRCH